MGTRPSLPKDEFFAKIDALALALTFDDVRLKTGHSEVAPDDVDVSTFFSRGIPLKIPIVSAAMDTVTEQEMAIELAKLGGLGVIHRNLTPEEQAEQVQRVKYHLNGLIEKPICVDENDTIEAILKRREEKGWRFHTFPVVNSEGKLVGIITQNDFDFAGKKTRKAKEIMTKDVIRATSDVTLGEAYKRMVAEKKKVLPLIDDAGKVVGLYVLSDVERIVTGSSNMYNVDDRGQLRVGAAIGVRRKDKKTGRIIDEAFPRLERLVKENVDVVVMDTSHGDTGDLIRTLQEIKQKYPGLEVVAGNISEPGSAKYLIEAGADGIKIGQGPGSICTTRVIGGIGCPQVTAVYNCSRVAEEYGIPVCADGGLVYSGDIPIAIGAGAHSVMLGNMLACAKEAPGKIVSKQGRRWKIYRGMGSTEAMESNQGSRERYLQSDAGKNKLIAQGVKTRVPIKGEAGDLVFQYLGGLRIGMGSVGAATIKELREKADFHRITRAGQVESHPHDVIIEEEAPNYEAPTPR